MAKLVDSSANNPKKNEILLLFVECSVKRELYSLVRGLGCSAYADQ